MAQWERAGPITQRSMDRNHPLLRLFFFFPSSKSLVVTQISCVWLMQDRKSVVRMDAHMHTLFFSTSSFKGYVPMMELRSFQPSGYLENGTELNTTEVPFDPTSIQWYEEIPLSEARLILERIMYPFKKVSSLPLALFPGHCRSFLSLKLSKCFFYRTSLLSP